MQLISRQQLELIKEEAVVDKDSIKGLLRNIEDRAILGLYNRVIELSNSYGDLEREYRKLKEENEQLRTELKQVRQGSRR